MKLLRELVRENDKLVKLIESFKKETLSLEALATQDVNKILGKYLSRVKDPNAKNDFLMQAISFLGRKSAVSPEDLDLVLRKHFAKNYDPAKLARQQTPAQKAGQQTPPPLPQDKPKFQSPSGKLPPLSQLAKQELEPQEPKGKAPTAPPPEKPHVPGMPDLPDFGAKKAPKKKEKEPEKKSDEDDIPTAKPSDVKTLRKKKEVDVDKIGEPMKKAAASAAEKKPKAAAAPAAVSTGGHKAPPPIDVPAFYKAGMKSQQGQSRWKVGDTVSLGYIGQAKVVDKVGNRWYLQTPDGKRYVKIPFKGTFSLDK